MKKDKIYCAICRKLIPEARRTRPTAVCSEPCKDKLDNIRKNQRMMRKCPHCLHPSTPKEREAYRVWRVDRGEIRSLKKVKRDDTLQAKNQLIEGLKTALRMAEDEINFLTAYQTAHPIDPELNGSLSPEAVESTWIERRLTRSKEFAKRVEWLITPRQL